MLDIEYVKQNSNFDIIENIRKYAFKGFDSIKEEDLLLFKWYGIVHEPTTEEYFMLRIRLPGGELKSDQALLIGELAEKYGKGFVNLTTRQTIQLHWLKIENIPGVLDKLNNVGLTTKGTSGDTVSNIVTCPVSGFEKDEVCDTRYIIKDLSDFLLKSNDFLNLPRKFKISISGCKSNCTKSEINDLGIVAVKTGEDGKIGFDLLVGGGLSSSPHLGRSIGYLVGKNNLKNVCIAILEIYRDYGDRSNRSRSRFKFLIDNWGIDRFNKVLEDKLGEKLDKIYFKYPRYNYKDHIGTFEQKQAGYYYKGISVPCGRIRSDQIKSLADLASNFGDGTLNTTAMQNIIILNIPEKHLNDVDKSISKIGLSTDPSSIEKGLVCCIGKDLCRYGLAHTKDCGIDILKRMNDIPVEDIKIHVTGCPHGCACHRIADIGLQGVLIKEGTKKKEGFEILIGGGLGENPTFGRRIKKVSVEESKIIVQNLLNNYIKNRKDRESFKEFYASYTDEEILQTMGL
ncbi:MAG: nitrite/sulfite reductase [Candidatus Methanoliparum thermophilum]|uniref:Nitrite/sulfite reductase n=1 Tax=Methanoliparum thermophilum TaxID=2491083 RepID=A0A520KSN6_METT2|nr:nitrite/sulfite reductase [Candidatus Methanoliparum sp. LAM-1]RZN64938.1 MAG: nitrite/sulfite reductase [Candidatus Methanoliparum thermophilum]BDC36180.1 ferredoxin--nitrite reductase [Candidatus Methanoliparum sp. LAM-1]